VVGFAADRVSASADRAPVVTSGAITVAYENVYSIHFTASDPEGEPLTVVTPPVNDDWISCDDGPATDFTCDYSSSRYFDPTPLPAVPFQRTIAYSVTDGTSTTTGVWNITVLPPPTLEITGRPTVTEGGVAVLHLGLSSNTYGALVFPVHATVVGDVANVISDTDFMVEVADGETTAELRIPIDDDAVDEPTDYFTVSVARADAIPYRFVDDSNLVTVLDDDGAISGDTTPPVIAPHRNVIVERGGSRPAWVPYIPPVATDAVDGPVAVMCNPAPMAMMPLGVNTVSCSATDSSGNMATSTFQVTVRSPKNNGSAKALDAIRDCVTAGQSMWVEADGFTPGASASVRLQSSGLEVMNLVTARVDKRGRVRQFVKVPSALPGDADIVILGPAGDDDLVRMLPVKIAHNRHRYGGRVVAFVRDHECDR
jgi:hypothetical protein